MDDARKVRHRLAIGELNLFIRPVAKINHPDTDFSFPPPSADSISARDKQMTGRSVGCRQIRDRERSASCSAAAPSYQLSCCPIWRQQWRVSHSGAKTVCQQCASCSLRVLLLVGDFLLHKAPVEFLGSLRTFDLQDKYRVSRSQKEKHILMVLCRQI